MLKAIFFDLDGTIRHNEPRGFDVFAEHASSLGLRVRDDDLLRAMRWEHYYWANSRELIHDQSRHGRLTVEFWAAYAQRQLTALGASNKQAAALAPAMNAYMEASYNPGSVVPADLSAVLEALTGAGYKLGVISNRDKPYQDLLAELGLAQHFPYTLASGEINAWKPDPKIFLHACKQQGVAPAESAYVGDNYFADVVGARAAGVTPVLYDPRGIFDNPQCATIRQFTELPRALGVNDAATRSKTAKAS